MLSAVEPTKPHVLVPLRPDVFYDDEGGMPLPHPLDDAKMVPDNFRPCRILLTALRPHLDSTAKEDLGLQPGLRLLLNAFIGA